MSRKPSVDRGFVEIAELIAAAKLRAVQSVNTALIDLYWQVGAIIGRKIEAADWGEGVVDQLAAYLARTHPGLRASRAGISFGCGNFTMPGRIMN